MDTREQIARELFDIGEGVTAALAMSIGGRYLSSNFDTLNASLKDEFFQRADRILHIALGPVVARVVETMPDDWRSLHLMTSPETSSGGITATIKGPWRLLNDVDREGLGTYEWLADGVGENVAGAINSAIENRLRLLMLDRAAEQEFGESDPVQAIDG